MIELTTEVGMKLCLICGMVLMMLIYNLLDNLSNLMTLNKLSKFMTANKLWDKYKTWKHEYKINKIKGGY